MARRKQFTVDASSVQGNPGATVTFGTLRVRDARAYWSDAAVTDYELLQAHIVGWSGIVDDDGNELPSPADDGDVLGELYIPEKDALIRLLFVGPVGEDAKN